MSSNNTKSFFPSWFWASGVLLLLLQLTTTSQAGLFSNSFPNFSTAKCAGSNELLGKFFEQAKQSICGQPLALNMVRSALFRHFESDNPKAPLVMSWHGDSGLGKSSLAELLSNTFNTISFMGQDSLSSFDSPTMIGDVGDGYTLNNAHQRVADAIRACPRTIVIFDDADLIPSTVIEQMNQFIDGSKKQFASKATFIFIMNLGLHEIHEASRDMPLSDDLSVIYSQQTEANLLKAKGIPDNFTELRTSRFFANRSGSDLKAVQERQDRLKQLKSMLYLSMSEPRSEPQAQAQGDATMDDDVGSVATPRQFLNQLVSRNLIQFTVPFFPMMLKEVSCCIEKELEILRDEYSSLKRKRIIIPLVDVSLKWFGYEKRALGFHSLEWHDVSPRKLAMMNEYDLNDISITGCRAAKSIITTEIVGAIDSYVEEQKAIFEKQEARKRRREDKNGKPQTSTTTWSSWFKPKPSTLEKLNFYDTDIYIRHDGTVGFANLFSQPQITNTENAGKTEL